MEATAISKQMLVHQCIDKVLNVVLVTLLLTLLLLLTLNRFTFEKKDSMAVFWKLPKSKGSLKVDVATGVLGSN